LSFTFVLQKEHPSKMRISINNDKTIFVTINAYVCNGTKQVQV
jgi:hypothetical protein